MTDYSELVKALRYCAESGDFNCNKDCPMYPNYPECLTKMDMDAAAAIEELQAQLPKRGEWYKPYGFTQKSYKRVCTNCQDVAYFCGKGNYRYCPNCGAKMEVQDGTD